MNDEVKKQLEEMANKWADGYSDCHIGDFLAGARAAWELATKPTPERGDITLKVIGDEWDANEFAKYWGGDIGHGLQDAFLAGDKGKREAVAAAVEKERDRCIDRVERIYADTSTGETVSEAIRRCKYAILNPPKEGGA